MTEKLEKIKGVLETFKLEQNSCFGAGHEGKVGRIYGKCARRALLALERIIEIIENK